MAFFITLGAYLIDSKDTTNFGKFKDNGEICLKFKYIFQLPHIFFFLDDKGLFSERKKGVDTFDFKGVVEKISPTTKDNLIVFSANIEITIG